MDTVVQEGSDAAGESASQEVNTAFGLGIRAHPSHLRWRKTETLKSHPAG